MHYQHSFNRDLERFEQACNWFTDKGFNYSKTRYKIYEKKLNFSNLSLKGIDILGIKNSFLEVYDFLKVYENLKDIDFSTWENQVNFIFKGSEFINTNDQARDYLFELYIASKFIQSKYHVKLDQITDIVANKGYNNIYIECKKVKNKDTIFKNIKKAAKQINIRLENISGMGIICIDISSALDSTYLMSDKPDENTLKLKAKMNYFLKEIINHKELNEIASNQIFKKVDGIFLYCRCFAVVTGDYPGFMHVSNTTIFPLNERVREIVPTLFNQDI